ncbi:MAG: hypothetical protein JKX99_04890 [Robiginitomaculum sp.]|nr:hypothetical protein [Robiginitomaculum sp.]
MLENLSESLPSVILIMLLVGMWFDRKKQKQYIKTRDRQFAILVSRLNKLIGHQEDDLSVPKSLKGFGQNEDDDLDS